MCMKNTEFKMLVCFDTETNDLPKFKIVNNKREIILPHVLQMSWIVYDERNKCIIATRDFIVANDVPISRNSYNIHGISKERVQNEGTDITYVLQLFASDLQRVRKVVAHNLKFDKVIIQEECKRHNIPDPFVQVPTQFCTMKYSIPICNIWYTNYKGKRVRKFPKLLELHNVLFPTDKYALQQSCLHDSLCDVFITLRCYVYLNIKDDIYNNVDEYKRYYVKDIERNNEEIQVL